MMSRRTAAQSLRDQHHWCADGERPRGQETAL